MVHSLSGSQQLGLDSRLTKSGGSVRGTVILVPSSTAANNGVAAFIDSTRPGIQANASIGLYVDPQGALRVAVTAVSVNPVEEGGETVLELTVGPNDLGRVIGKQGRTARAMRNLLGAAGLKFHKRYTLEILE